MNESLKITFTPGFLNYGEKLTPPEPAVKHIPEWYKSLAKHDSWNTDDKLNPVNHIGTDGAQVATKMCMPFFDSLSAGYQYLLEDDLHIGVGVDGKPTLSWDGPVMLVDVRPTIDLPLPNNCHAVHFGWRMNWYYETPPGYSVLITHPLNRTDLPFQTLSGIVESDIWGLPVFTAFFLHRDFVGTIKKGTPIFQMIPFKRENWEMEVLETEQELDKHELRAENRRSMLYGYYKKTAWRKKLFGNKHSDIKNIEHDDE